MDKILLQKVIQKKEKNLSVLVLGNAGIAAFIGGLVGLIVGNFYAFALGSMILHIGNVLLYGVIGFAIGWFEGKGKKESAEVELMLLKDLQNRLE